MTGVVRVVVIAAVLGRRRLDRALVQSVCYVEGALQWLL